MYKKLILQTSLGEYTVIQRTTDYANIPCDPANTDYQAYLAWLAEGNQPLPAEE